MSEESKEVQYSNIKDGGIAAFVTHFHTMNLIFDGTRNQCHHLVLSTIASNNDVCTLSQMLKLDDIKDFALAMMKEVEDHESHDHWELSGRNKLPAGAKTFP